MVHDCDEAGLAVAEQNESATEPPAEDKHATLRDCVPVPHPTLQVLQVPMVQLYVGQASAKANNRNKENRVRTSKLRIEVRKRCA
jgi:hypothetical protein